MYEIFRKSEKANNQISISKNFLCATKTVSLEVIKERDLSKCHVFAPPPLLPRSHVLKST